MVLSFRHWYWIKALTPRYPLAEYQQVWSSGSEVMFDFHFVNVDSIFLFSIYSTTTRAISLISVFTSSSSLQLPACQLSACYVEWFKSCVRLNLVTMVIVYNLEENRLRAREKALLFSLSFAVLALASQRPLPAHNHPFSFLVQVVVVEKASIPRDSIQPLYFKSVTPTIDKH